MWHGQTREMYGMFERENLKYRGHLEDAGEDERIILKRIFKQTGWESTDWIQLAQDRNQWWVVMQRVMNIWVP